MDTMKFKAPPPMSGPVENWNKSKFCDFYADKGHNTNECIQVKKQIKGQIRTIFALNQGVKAGEQQRRTPKSCQKGRNLRQGEGPENIHGATMAAVRSPSPYNGIIGRLGIRKIQFVPSTAHGMLKFLVKEGIVTLYSSTIIPMECKMTAEPQVGPIPSEPTTEKGIKVATHPEYPEQTVTRGESLFEKGRMELCNLLKDNLDVFA
ncbi:hypothetical protein Tco_1445471 [Tanacetum coccineum]